MSRCGCEEHGLEYITFYVKKTYGTFGGLFWASAGSCRVARDARICENRLLHDSPSTSEVFWKNKGKLIVWIHKLKTGCGYHFEYFAAYHN